METIHTLRRHVQGGANDPEEPKIVLDGSRWHALSRNAVHLPPVAVFSILFALSYGHYYIGPTFVESPERNGLFSAGIQICAKLEELLCVASLTMIVLHALRHELLGDGVPIGLLGSAIWFTSLAAFWSPDFIGSFSWARPSWHRARLYILLVVCGLIAATIGPASAVLMLPREQNIPAGGSSFYLYGRSDQFFPGTVASATEPNFCTLSNATEYGLCPSGGWKSLSKTLGAFSYRGYDQRTGGDARYSPLRQAKGAEGNRAWDSFMIQSPRNVPPHVINSVRSRYRSDYNTVAIQPHAATAAVMQKLREQWIDGASQRGSGRNGQYKWTYNLQTLGSAVNPWVRVKCSTAQNLSVDADTAAFPFLQSFGSHDVGWAFRVNPDEAFKKHTITGLQRNPSSQIRAQWLPLPIKEFGVEEKGFNTTGLLIELPWSGDSRAAVTCGITAAWHNGTIRSERSTTYGAWSIALSMFDYGKHDDSPTYTGTNTPVTLDESWLGLLTPLVSTSSPDTDTTPFTTLETILNNSGITELPNEIRAAAAGAPGGVCTPEEAGVNATDAEAWRDAACFNLGYYFIEQAVAMVVADGLSRFSSWRVMNLTSLTTLEVPTFNRSQMLITSRYGENANRTLTADDSTMGWFAVFVSGWSYYPNKVSDYLSLAPIAAYLLLVTLYIIYTVLCIPKRGHGTSASWDSVTELLVLCQNSTPPQAPSRLTNTSAGIEHLKTFRNVVKVRAFPSQDGEGAPNLRLVLDDDSIKGYPSTDSTSKGSSSRSSSLSGKPVQPGVTNVLLTDLTIASNSPARPRSTYHQRDQGQIVQMDQRYG